VMTAKFGEPSPNAWTSYSRRNGRIADLETELLLLKDDKKQLRNDLDEAHELVDKMRERVEDGNSLIESWIEVFDMQQNEDGLWEWNEVDTFNWKAMLMMFDDHRALVREWNKRVDRWNTTFSPRNVGRPLQASESQVQDVRRLRKDGVSLRAIASQTALGLGTVRTILDQSTSRERSRTGELRREHYDKMAGADFKAKMRGREYLEKRINSTLKSGAELVKAAKGLGKG
jgi:hypothetical protein